MEIRKAASSDIQPLSELILELHKELSAPEPCAYAASDLEELALELMGSGDLAALVAERQGEAIGVLLLNGCASLYAGRFGEITELYVKPQFRSSGVGEALIAAARDYARELGWSRLEVGTPELPAWERSAAFYRRNGFIETGVRMKLPLRT